MTADKTSKMKVSKVALRMLTASACLNLVSCGMERDEGIKVVETTETTTTTVVSPTPTPKFRTRKDTTVSITDRTFVESSPIPGFTTPAPLPHRNVNSIVYTVPERGTSLPYILDTYFKIPRPSLETKTVDPTLYDNAFSALGKEISSRNPAGDKTKFTPGSQINLPSALFIEEKVYLAYGIPVDSTDSNSQYQLPANTPYPGKLATKLPSRGDHGVKLKPFHQPWWKRILPF
jgi:hypothetical protein